MVSATAVAIRKDRKKNSDNQRFGPAKDVFCYFFYFFLLLFDDFAECVDVFLVFGGCLAVFAGVDVEVVVGK